MFEKKEVVKDNSDVVENLRALLDSAHTDFDEQNKRLRLRKPFHYSCGGVTMIRINDGFQVFFREHDSEKYHLKSLCHSDARELHAWLGENLEDE